MNKKGFTLVELLAVITLVGIFLLVTIPTVDSLLKKQKDKLYKIQKNNVTEALKTWGNVNLDSLPEETGQYVEVTLNDLKIEGLVEDDLKNPKTDICYANTNTFTISKKGEEYIYTVGELVDGTSSDCTITND